MRWILKMKPADCPWLGGESVVDLGNGALPTGGGQFFSTEKTREKATRISKALARNAPKAGER